VNDHLVRRRRQSVPQDVLLMRIDVRPVRVDIFNEPAPRLTGCHGRERDVLRVVDGIGGGSRDHHQRQDSYCQKDAPHRFSPFPNVT
jgi:hypothetical protein